ncbi:MAG TPA: glycosyltransferase family 39 protein, partial [Flavobacteriales bacterium]|nr:glycosyltransferase family 39 protein [Flavobacteriales bacterium]
MADTLPLASTPAGDAAPSRRWEVPTVWALFIVLSYFPLFLNLDALPLREWDESRQAISAYEMMKSHDFLVARFEGEPDMWSTKPPFLVWCQALLFMLFGPGELALRLPSAICAFLTGAALLYVCIRWLRRPWMGLIAAMLLCTAQGYVTSHVSRTGDYDAMLTFFLVVMMVCAFRFERSGSKRAVGWLFAALALAILTKSVQGVLMLPGIGLYLLFTGAWRGFLRLRHTWIGLGAVIVAVG